jgi:hypothetical protein
MPFLFRTRLSAVEPSTIALTVERQARVRVRGNAYGFVRVLGELRWVSGVFDETFRITRKSGRIRVMVLGLGGVASQTVCFVADRDLTVRRPPAVIRRVRWSRVHVARLSALSAHSIQRGLSEHERE